MDLRKKHSDRTDGEETQYVPMEAMAKVSTDKYDTRELSADEIRRQAELQQRQQQRTAAQQQPHYPQQGGMPMNQNGGYYGQPNQNRPMQPQQPYYPQQGGMPMNQNGGYYGQPNQNRPMQQQQPHYPQQGGMPVNQNGGYYGQPNQNRPVQPQGSPANHQNGGYAPTPTPPVQHNHHGSTGTINRPNPHNNDGGGSYQPQQTPPAPNPPHNTNPQKRKRKPKKPPVWQTILKFVLIAIIAVFLIYSLIAVVGIIRTNIVSTGSRSRTAEAMYSTDVSNVLVIGTDSRDLETDRGRSDSMILLSINSQNNTIYMTSLLRDVYVYINDEYGYGKLNAAYAYGGAELLMDTIESNYLVRIDDYVLLSFTACAEMIDAVGGVEIDLSDEEALALNDILISEVNELMGDSRNADLLTNGGTQTLNGKQALSYSRIRYVGNADFERTSRQRTVMSQVLKKASHNPVALSKILFNALPEISTNISGMALYGYSLKAPVMLLHYDTAAQQMPTDGSFYGDSRNGESVLIADFAQNQQYLKDTVYAEK